MWNATVSCCQSCSSQCLRILVGPSRPDLASNLGVHKLSAMKELCPGFLIEMDEELCPHTNGEVNSRSVRHIQNNLMIFLTWYTYISHVYIGLVIMLWTKDSTVHRNGANYSSGKYDYIIVCTTTREFYNICHESLRFDNWKLIVTEISTQKSVHALLERYKESPWTLLKHYRICHK